MSPAKRTVDAHRVVLVDGDDPALLSEAVAGLVDELVGDADRALVVEDHRGDEVDLAAVADGAATPPFLTDRRVVVVRDIGRYNTEDVQPLLQYLEDPLPTTVLVLVVGEGTIAPKLLSAVKAQGHVQSTKVRAREAGDWLRGRLRSAGLRIDPAAEKVIAAHLGEDRGRVGSLIGVLTAAYGEGERIGVDEIEPYLGEAGSVAPWDFTDAIDAGQTQEALALLHRLLGAGDRHPLVVLAILHRHVQSMLRVDRPTVRTEAQAATAMGIAPGRSTYPAKKALASARRWGSVGVASAIGLIADAELDLKGASAWPPEAVLEVLVARLCFLARARGGSRPAARAGSRAS